MELAAETKAMLEDKAKQIRRHIVSMLAEAGSGHPGDPFPLPILSRPFTLK